MIIAAIPPALISPSICPSYPVADGYTGPVDRCGYPLPPVPGPLPIAAVGGAWAWSRRIRKRIRQATPQENND